MRTLCPSHRANLLKSPRQAINTCRSMIAKGTESHRLADYQLSCQHFQTGVEISQLLLLNAPCPEMIALRVIAGHNLSASYVAQGQNQHAETALHNLHREICELCQACHLKRCVRLEALSQLDTTLFSLTSQLSHMGKNDSLHAAIHQTEEIAEQTAQQLFH